jgi:hypothetical protein
LLAIALPVTGVLAEAPAKTGTFFLLKTPSFDFALTYQVTFVSLAVGC